MLPKVIRVIVLSMVAGLLSCILLMGVLYAIYRGAMIYGFTSDGALLVTGLCVALALCAVVSCISCTLAKLRTSPLPRMSRLADVVESFLEGLNKGSATQKPRRR